MSRLSYALLAGVAAIALVAAADPHGHPAHPSKTTTHAGHAATHASHASHATAHTTVHTTVHRYESVHRGASARYSPVHTERHTWVVPHATVTRIEDESSTRIREMAHTTTPIGRVRLQREAVRTIRTHRAPLAHATFITGTVVSRRSNEVVVRTQSGSTVTVVTQSVPIAPAVLTAGSTVALPVQYVNSGWVLVPAYTTTEQTALVNQPMLAPCAINDNDADDAGDTNYYAPPGACSNNGGDADDGYNFSIPALPSSFASIPQVFSSSFEPVVAAGYVVAQSGSNVVLLTSDFKPMVVNASPALSSGATNGALSPGRYVVVYGYDVNNTLIATSLM